MPELVANCPRCGANHMTFDLISAVPTTVSYSWLVEFEGFSLCRKCHTTTVFVLRQLNISNDKPNGQLPLKSLMEWKSSANDLVNVSGYISLKDAVGVEPPEHLPKDIEDAFKEGAKCLAVGCYNAAATMFRLCVDLGTRCLLPQIDQPPTAHVRRALGLRLAWLLDNGRLPESLRELSTAVKDDGNDGAHEGTLMKADAEDLLDFAFSLLERMYTEPKQLALAKERRAERRKPQP